MAAELCAIETSGRARKTAGTEQKNGWMALRSAGWMGLSGVARPEQPARQQSAFVDIVATITNIATSLACAKTGKVAAVAGPHPARSRFFARFVRGS